MTNPINYQNQAIPAYSGITINITQPTLNAAPLNQTCPSNCTEHSHQHPNFTVQQPLNNAQQYGVTNPNINRQTLETGNQALTQKEFAQNEEIKQSQSIDKAELVTDKNISSEQNLAKQNGNNIQNGIPQAYPPQYYLNNYNYIQNGEKEKSQPSTTGLNTQPNPQEIQLASFPELNNIPETQEEDMSSSQEIINELDSRVAEQKELEKNGKKTKVVALTNEYIMSLENYLNNPNTEIRLMAAKEVLTRLDEDKERFDDAALNALLNKMLQDPEKLVRIAALSAFSSQLASGNDFTVNLLTKIQNNPNADKEDALQAADSLLKMSTRTEIRYAPVNNMVMQQQVEQQ